jgi:hypothetical protein
MIVLATDLPLPIASLDELKLFVATERRGTMKLQRAVFVLIGMMFLFAGKSSAQQVKTDYDRAVNFGQYKTYSWEKVQTKDPLLVDRIKSAVNSALTAKGLTEVPSGGDLEVFAIETTQNQQTLDTFYNGFGGGRRWGGFGGFGDATTTVETYKVGTLVIDLFDAKTEKLIWRSSSSDTLSNNADKNTKNLNKGVNKMFQHFPPASSTKH